MGDSSDRGDVPEEERKENREWISQRDRVDTTYWTLYFHTSFHYFQAQLEARSSPLETSLVPAQLVSRADPNLRLSIHTSPDLTFSHSVLIPPIFSFFRLVSQLWL